jgi:hypothetical protein
MNQSKLTAERLLRKAIVYIRQSSPNQVLHHQESQRRQYGLVDRARDLGFQQVIVIDEDLGRTGSGFVERPGFQRLVAEVCSGGAGAVFCIEASRLARNGRDWHHLIELCGMAYAVVVDFDGVYDPNLVNDRLLLGLNRPETRLTILQHGYPTDTYLGLPIFENTLVESWPDNPEYEFRDSSYSGRHVAVYHGWLPLYAIAASFAIYRVQPDSLDPIPSVKHDLNERKRLTSAARMPAVLFGVGFLVCVFVGANMLYGRDAAWTALILGAIHPWHIANSRQARYYSAQLLLRACCVLVWLMIRRGEWKHFVLAGLGFVLLFHTHLLSFVTAGLVVLFATPLIWKNQKRAIAKLVTFGLIVAGGTLPWLILTGFLTHQGHLPRAWPLLRLPWDLVEFPPLQLRSLLIGVPFAAAVVWALLTGESGSSRIKKPLLESAPSVLLIAVWIGCGYTAFLALVPAASFDTARLNLSYWGPALIGISVMCAAAARMITARIWTPAAVALGLVLFVVAGNLSGLWTRRGPGRSWMANARVIDWLCAMPLQQDTKLYAAPNSHLIWTVYTGLPVQSILPVRKQFLNNYRGEIVYIDSPVSSDNDVLSREHIEDAAAREGYPIARDSA